MLQEVSGASGASGSTATCEHKREASMSDALSPPYLSLTESDILPHLHALDGLHDLTLSQGQYIICSYRCPALPGVLAPSVGSGLLYLSSAFNSHCLFQAPLCRVEIPGTCDLSSIYMYVCSAVFVW